MQYQRNATPAHISAIPAKKSSVRLQGMNARCRPKQKVNASQIPAQIMEIRNQYEPRSRAFLGSADLRALPEIISNSSHAAYVTHQITSYHRWPANGTGSMRAPPTLCIRLNVGIISDRSRNPQRR